MNNLISLAYLTLPNTHPVDQIEIAAACGYGGVGLRTLPQNPPAEPDYSLANQDLFYQVRAALQRTGIRLMDLEIAKISDDIDVTAYEEDLAKGAELGAKYVTASVWTPDVGRALRQFELLCFLAQKHGLTVALEFVPFSNVPGFKEALNFIYAAGNPNNAMVLFDLLHGHRDHVTRTQLETTSANKIGFLHLCDGPGFIPPLGHPDMISVTREKRLYIGDGEIDCAGLVLGAREAEYCAVELPNVAEMNLLGKMGHAKKCLETTKAFLDSLPEVES